MSKLDTGIDFTAAAAWADARKGDPEERGNRYWDIWNVARAFSALYQNRYGVCEWSQDSDGNWETGCGEMFVFEDGGPAENGQRYCGYCGKPLAVESNNADGFAEADQ